jgi:hypothetical protein
LARRAVTHAARTVIAEKRPAVTGAEWQRRFNVAASRAKDQMWLFRSVGPEQLSITDHERGFHVTPQVEVNGRGIDLVVTGAKGRLAVECDGAGLARHRGTARR